MHRVRVFLKADHPRSCRPPLPQMEGRRLSVLFGLRKESLHWQALF